MKFSWFHFLMMSSLALLTLAALHLSRRPLCINSRVVERIDRVSGESSESVWRCSFNRETVYPAFLGRALPRLQERVLSVEEGLWRIEPFHQPLRIVILAQRPYAYQLFGRTLFIGETLLREKPEVLERGIVKAWLSERQKVFSNLIAGDLVADVQTDLLLEILSGKKSWNTKGEQEARWPEVLKDADSYCDSSWKMSEHEEICHHHAEILEGKTWSLSLRPLLSQALVQTWNESSLSQQIQLLHSFPKWVSGPRIEKSSEDSAQGGVLQVSMNSLILASRSLGLSASATEDPLWISFGVRFVSHLRERGFQEVQPEMHLDNLILADGDLQKDSPLLQKMDLLSTKNRRMKLAVKDAHSLWLFPGLRKIPLEKSAGLKAQRTAVLRCGDFDFDWVLSFEAQTEKLFVVKSCDSKVDIDLRPWILEGAEGFALAQRGLNFVEFHLPSLALKKETLDRHGEVMATIQRRDVSDPLFQLLGWQELNWSEKVGAYHPKAYVEAIEWFRLN